MTVTCKVTATLRQRIPLAFYIWYLNGRSIPFLLVFSALALARYFMFRSAPQLDLLLPIDGMPSCHGMRQGYLEASDEHEGCSQARLSYLAGGD